MLAQQLVALLRHQKRVDSHQKTHQSLQIRVVGREDLRQHHGTLVILEEGLLQECVDRQQSSWVQREDTLFCHEQEVVLAIEESSLGQDVLKRV